MSTHKVIFITVGETSVARSLLRTGFWTTVRAHKEIQVVLLAAADLHASIQDEFAGENVVVEVAPLYQPRFFEKVLFFLERNGFQSGTNKIMQHRARELGESRIPVWVKEMICFLMQHAPFLHRIVRFSELRIYPVPCVKTLFDTYQPSLVLATIIVNSDTDVPILREARRRGIQTIGMVRGWDNLTTYGIVRVLPDDFFAQNEFVSEKAQELHGIEKRHISVVGTPAFDIYRRIELDMSREKYCANLGIDPSKEIILYAAIGDFLFPQEGEMADVFERLIDSGRITDNAVVVFRAHPAFKSPLERMRSLRHVIPDRKADYRGNDLRQWDMKDESNAHLVNSIRHASVVVTAGSTMMIEAALCGKPVITVGFDPGSQERYWFSIARWVEMAVHIVDLLRTRGVRVAHSRDELAIKVSLYLQDPSQDTDYRQRLVERFVGPHRGDAGSEIARQMLATLRRVGNTSVMR